MKSSISKDLFYYNLSKFGQIYFDNHCRSWTVFNFNITSLGNLDQTKVKLTFFFSGAWKFSHYCLLLLIIYPKLALVCLIFTQLFLRPNLYKTNNNPLWWSFCKRFSQTSNTMLCVCLVYWWCYFYQRKTHKALIKCVISSESWHLN